MARYLDPKNDLTFKRIFADHPDLLTSFLNAVMPFSPDGQVQEIEYLAAEQVPDITGLKNSIVDVKCKDKTGRVFVVEMQMLWTDDFMNRIVFNAGKAYVRQLEKSKSYGLLRPVYTLAILNQNYDHKTDDFYHHYAIVNRENTDEVIEGLEFVLVELEKFRPQHWNARRAATPWLRFLRDVDEKTGELPTELAENEQVRRAAELCEQGAYTPEELAVYEAYWDSVRVQKTLLEGFLAKGRAEGRAEGMAERDQLAAERDAARKLAEELTARIAELERSTTRKAGVGK